MTDDRKCLEEARHRVAIVAAGMAVALGPTQAAFILAGAASAVLVKALGKEKASEFFAELGEAIASDEGEGVPETLN
jgi:hypothetical protein